MIRILYLIFVGILLSSCAAVDIVAPDRSYFSQGTRYVVHDLKGNERGNILLKYTNKSFQGDLVYRSYEKEISNYLIQNGFRTTTDENEADYLGYINYGFVSDQKEKNIIDTTIKGKSVYFETQNLEITNPTRIMFKGKYGYERSLTFRMYDLNKDNSNGILILDSKLTSKGSCNKLGEMRELLTTMMFKNFPGKNEEVEKITIPQINFTGC